MQTVNLRSRVGTDGVLHLDISSGYRDAELDVTVTVQPVDQLANREGVSTWPPGFLENVAGAWKGEPLVREEVGSYECRAEL